MKHKAVTEVAAHFFKDNMFLLIRYFFSVVLLLHKRSTQYTDLTGT